MVPEALAGGDSTERLVLERVRLYCSGTAAGTRLAPDGRVLARAEPFVVGEGRAFLRQALQASLEAEGPALEKKGRRPGPKGRPRT